MSKILVLFVFHEFNERVLMFLNKSIFYDDYVDFIIICNNKSIDINSYIKYTNTSVLYRDNNGWDFGGWSDGLLTDNLYMNYSHFIFVNSTVIGPFLKPSFRGKWTDIYVKNLTNNVKLFGSFINANIYDESINDPKLSWASIHVQSFIFSMDKEALDYLIVQGIFSNKYYTKTQLETIQNREIKMSRCIIENGWNIGSLLRRYRSVDFTMLNKNIINYNDKFLGDIAFPKYENKLWIRENVVFIKGNR